MTKMLVDAYKIEEKLRNILPPMYSNDYGQGFCDAMLTAIAVIMNTAKEEGEHDEEQNI